MKKFVRTRGAEAARAPPPPPPAPPATRANGHATPASSAGGPSVSTPQPAAVVAIQASSEPRALSSRAGSPPESRQAARGDDRHRTAADVPPYGAAGGAPRPHQPDHHSSLSSGAVGSRAWGGGALWEDPEFPASWRALGPRRCPGGRGLRWLRPHELCARPTFLGDEPAAADDEDASADSWRVEPGELGELGDAHLGRACAALSLTPRLLARVAPPRPARYTGAVSFRFWVWGAWREVTVDDRLPTRAGRLLGARAAATAARTDFTLPLLEKAYAKLYGSYRALRAGSLPRALQDLTGGVVQSFALQKQPRALALQVLAAAAPRSTLLLAAGRGPHAPAAVVTGLARGADGEPMVRLQAEPHGHYWQPFSVFVSSFVSLCLVHVGPDDWLSEPALHARRPWRAVLAKRRWRRGHNAGGPPSAKETTGANPMFHVSVPAGAAGAAGAAGRCHVVVSVTQQYEPRGRRRLLAVGFAVYQLAEDAPTRPDVARLRPLDVTHESRAREVVTFFTLPAGRYLVVPHTGRPHADAGFLLRVFTDDRTDVWEANEDNAIVHNVWAEFLDDGRAIPAEASAGVGRLLARLHDEEVDAETLRGVLRRARGWRAAGSGRALCGALVALRDGALRGRVPARELPALLALLQHWRAAWRREAGGGPRAPALRLRALLAAAGLSASNKVLECLVLRFARGDYITAEAFVVALARLHLAHERYRSLDMKLKSNPLSLEEMILMTIYS